MNHVQYLWKARQNIKLIKKETLKRISTFATGLIDQENKLKGKLVENKLFDKIKNLPFIGSSLYNEFCSSVRLLNFLSEFIVGFCEDEVKMKSKQIKPYFEWIKMDDWFELLDLKETDKPLFEYLYLEEESGEFTQESCDQFYEFIKNEFTEELHQILESSKDLDITKHPEKIPDFSSTKRYTLLQWLIGNLWEKMMESDELYKENIKKYFEHVVQILKDFNEKLEKINEEFDSKKCKLEIYEKTIDTEVNKNLVEEQQNYNKFLEKIHYQRCTYINQAFCKSTLFSQCYLVAYLINKVDKENMDWTLHETLREYLQGLTSKLNNTSGKNSECHSSVVSKFTEDHEIVIEQNNFEYAKKNIIKKNVNEIKITFEKPKLRPNELVMIYGYYKNKYLGKDSLVRKLVHIIKYQDLLNKKDESYLTYKAQFHAISVVAICESFRKEDCKIKFKIEGLEYISQPNFDTIEGLIDNITLRKCETFKMQLTDFNSNSSLKGISKQDEKIITEFLRSEFFLKGTLKKDSDDAKCNGEIYLPYIKKVEEKDYTAETDALFRLIHEKSQRFYFVNARIAGEQGLRLQKLVCMTLIYHFDEWSAFSEIFECYENILEERKEEENKYSLTPDQKLTIFNHQSYKKVESFWIECAPIRQEILKKKSSLPVPEFNEKDKNIEEKKAKFEEEQHKKIDEYLDNLEEITCFLITRV